MEISLIYISWFFLQFSGIFCWCKLFGSHPKYCQLQLNAFATRDRADRRQTTCTMNITTLLLNICRTAFIWEASFTWEASSILLCCKGLQNKLHFDLTCRKNSTTSQFIEQPCIRFWKSATVCDNVITKSTNWAKENANKH